MLFFWAFSLLWTDALVARSGHMSNERLECSAGTFKKTSSFQSKRLSLCTHIFLAVLAVAFLRGIYETYCCDKIVDYNITWPSIKCLSCQRKTEHGKLLRNILMMKHTKEHLLKYNILCGKIMNNSLWLKLGQILKRTEKKSEASYFTQQNFVSSAIFFRDQDKTMSQSGSYFEEGGEEIFGKLLFVCQVLNLRLGLIARGGRLDNKRLKTYPLCRTNNTVNKKIQSVRQTIQRVGQKIRRIGKYKKANVKHTSLPPLVFVLYLALWGVHHNYVCDNWQTD